MPLHLLFRWNHLNSFSISVSSYTSFSNHLFKGCDRPWWVSFANKIAKALLKHNHHKLYISGMVMELSSGYNCSVLAWSNFVNQTCFFELINQVTNLTTQVKGWFSKLLADFSIFQLQSNLYETVGCQSPEICSP